MKAKELMLTEDYVSFEIAKLLSKIGFDGEFHKYYWGYEPGKEFITEGSFNSEYDYPAPTLQMTMKWLREVHNICVYCYPSNLRIKEYGDWEAGACLIQENVSIIFNNNSHSFYANSYEEAVEAVIKYCLEWYIKTI